jgi:hypothetical protein
MPTLTASTGAWEGGWVVAPTLGTVVLEWALPLGLAAAAAAAAAGLRLRARAVHLLRLSSAKLWRMSPPHSGIMSAIHNCMSVTIQALANFFAGFLRSCWSGCMAWH